MLVRIFCHPHLEDFVIRNKVQEVGGTMGLGLNPGLNCKKE